MPLVKIGSKHQVTIPKEIFEQLRLKPGDYVEAKLSKGKVVLTPKEIADKGEDAWFWSEAWQAKERRADEDIKAGRVKRFKDVEALIKDLKD